MLLSLRCGAKTRSDKPCRSPAVSGKKRAANGWGGSPATAVVGRTPQFGGLDPSSFNIAVELLSAVWPNEGRRLARTVPKIRPLLTLRNNLPELLHQRNTRRDCRCQRQIR